MKGIRKQPGELPVADDDWQRGGDRQRLSSECIMVVPPQLDVDVDVGTFPSRDHLDVSLSRPYQRHSDTGYRQAANQAGQARLECRPQFWFSFCSSFSVSQATDLAGHRLRAAIDDTLTGHYRHTCKRLILIATDPLGLRVRLHLLLPLKLLFKLF